MVSAKHYFQDFVGLLFPNLCNACGTPLFRGEHLVCLNCIHHLPYTDYHIHFENRVAKQLWGRMEFEAAMAMLYFRKGASIQNLMHNLKYNQKTEIGLLLGRLLGDKLLESSLYKGIDFIVPVPLHPKRLQKRGYNQSAFIAMGVAEKIEVTVNEGLLLRTTHTDSQTKKNRYNRYQNMKDVFSVESSEPLCNKHILLVDDVITTGATIEACANALTKSGVAKVSIAALAFAD
ncbi:ComF family protein [Pedobacter sp. UYP30]|uniref:ComF family protein n=1 Tax=Pedobacter sp. UYP30 TaxID=1756400 RepID=UPI00339A9ECA